MEVDKKYLADLTAACERKAADLESRQQLCSEELEAIVKSIEIISSPAVKGNAEKHLDEYVYESADHYEYIYESADYYEYIYEDRGD
jgi:hypothetical protein